MKIFVNEVALYFGGDVGWYLRRVEAGPEPASDDDTEIPSRPCGCMSICFSNIYDAKTM